MGRSRLADLSQIIQPGLSQFLLLQKLPETEHRLLLLVIIPGIADAQANPEPLLLRRLHYPVQLLKCVGIVSDRVRLRLKLPPGDGQHDGIETIRGNLGQLLLHVVTLRIPEIDHPCIRNIGHRLRLLRRRRRHIPPGRGSKSERQGRGRS